MAQLERPQRHIDDTSSKAPTIQTMEQLLRAGEGSKLSPKKLSPKITKLSPTFSSSSSAPASSPSSPFFPRLKQHHDSEEDHGQNQKKSVLTKVKEKAKKLRNSLSKKKQDDGNSTPTSRGVAGLESDGAEEDAENLGAPVYGSETAPEGDQENSRQHPKPSPFMHERKNVLPCHDKPQVEHSREKLLTRSLSKRASQPETSTVTIVSANTPPSIIKTMTKSASEKLTTSNKAEGSNAAHSITSKTQGGLAADSCKHEKHKTSSPTDTNSLAFSAPQTPPSKIPSQTISIASRTTSAPVTPLDSIPVTAPTSPSSAPADGRNHSSHTSQLWDKGVSMKEYFMNKLEPGEDEKALSQVISEAMSPRRTPGDAGVMEKVREAVTSLLRNEEPNKYADTKITTTPVSATANTTRASFQIPVSTNAHEVDQEENHGRILQTN